MKKLYNKIAPVISKITLAGLIISLLGLLGAKYYLNVQNSKEVIDAWAVFYGMWAELITTIVLCVCAPLYVIFDIRNLWDKYIRKAIVSLKRNPSTIPLLMMLATFVFYSLNLTDVSNTTAKIQGKGMGLCQFCIMLLSMLSLVCMLNAFPRRKKANVPMIVLMFVMFGIIIFCDNHYSNMILAALNAGENSIAITDETKYIALAFNMLNVHMIMTIICAALVALMPVYSKLIRKINTSVALDENANMAQIEIQD